MKVKADRCRCAGCSSRRRIGIRKLDRARLRAERRNR
jgi:hypothetical protein